jgi:hypothetical protein
VRAGLRIRVAAARGMRIARMPTGTRIAGLPMFPIANAVTARLSL